MVAADAAGGEDDRLGGELEVAGLLAVALAAPRTTVLGASTLPRDAGGGSAGDDELVDAVAESELDQAAVGRRAHAAHERLEHARGRFPR